MPIACFKCRRVNQLNGLTFCCSAKFQALLATPQTEVVVLQRMCLALGAIAARGGPDIVRSFTAQAVQLARDACNSGDQVGTCIIAKILTCMHMRRVVTRSTSIPSGLLQHPVCTVVNRLCIMSCRGYCALGLIS